jgi:hypothetical protein
MQDAPELASIRARRPLPRPFPRRRPLAPFVPARAVVTLKEETVSSGLAGFGYGTSERSTEIAGDLSRTERGFARDTGHGPAGRVRTSRACTDAHQSSARGQVEMDEQEDAAAADNAGDAIAHGDVSSALGGRFGHRLGKAFQKKAEASTTPGAGSSGAQGGGLTITTDVAAPRRARRARATKCRRTTSRSSACSTDPRAEDAALRRPPHRARSPVVPRRIPGEVAPGCGSPNPGAPSGAPRKEHR